MRALVRSKALAAVSVAAAVPAARAAAPPPPPRRAATAAGRTSAAAAADVPLTTADPAPANRAAESDVVAREIGTMTLLGLCTRRSIAEILLFYEDKDIIPRGNS